MQPPKAARHRATILFCDIREFTALFDRRDPLEVVDFANRVLSELGRVVERSGGVIDKFTGDGFLAHFGIEGNNRHDHAARACYCALRLQKQLNEMNDGRHIEDQPVLQLGIGINTGEVATAFISTYNKTEFTVLGGTVNTASRVESLTKYFSVDCLISEDTMKAVEGRFEVQAMPPKGLRGMAGQHVTYWLLPTNESESFHEHVA